MQYRLLLAFVLLFFVEGYSQTIKVLSKEDKQPIVGVAVFNDLKTKGGITDFDGQVDISNFSENESITFQHVAHLSITTLKSQIINGRVYLEEDTSALDEILLSVSKFGQKEKDITQQIVSITSADVAFRNPQTAADLLQGSGQVYVQKSQLGGGSPLIRGFSTNRLLIAVDGIRFNTAIFRGGNVQNVISIDPFTIENTEVILGPGSVVYGSDAVGGVMNFYTKKPKFSFEEGISFSGNATARYATANKEKTGHVDFNIGLKEWSFLTSVTFSDFDDLRQGKHGPDDYLRNEYVAVIDGVDTIVTNDNPLIQKPTGYNQINTMQKVRFSPNERWNFNLGLFYTTTSDYPRYDRLIRRRNGNLRAAEWFYGPQTWLSGNLQITSTQEAIALYDKSNLTLSFQQFGEGRNDRDFGDTILFETDEIVDAYSAGWDFTKKIGKGNLYYGLEYVFNRVHSAGEQTDITTNITTPTASRYPNGSSWQSAAAYTSLQYALTEDLSFQGGLRYNYIKLFADFSDNNRFFEFPFSEANIDTGALTGSAGLSWKASDILRWKANFSTAFRAPNIDDVGKIFDSEPGSIVVPNPNLKPENATSGDVGFSLNFDNVVKLDVSTYYTVLDDALIRRDFTLNGESEIDFQGELSNVQAIQNAARAEVYGFEGGVEINFNKVWQLTSQFNITKGFEEDAEGNRNPIRHAAPNFGNTHLTFTKKKLKLDAFAIYNGQFEFADLAPSQQNNAFLYATNENGDPFSPRWYTLNFAAQYELTKQLQLNITLENITDQRYRTYSSGISAAGRNLIVAANYKF